MKHTLLAVIFVLFFSSCKESVDKDLTEGIVLDFSFAGFSNAESFVDNESKTITLELPYETNVKELRPTIAITEGYSIIPASGTVQDFSGQVFYTLVSPKGAKVIYTVKIGTAAQPQPVIYSVLADSVEAGFKFEVQGKHFGRFALDVKVNLQKGEDKVGSLFEFKNDSTLIVQTNEVLSPGEYGVEVFVKNLSASASEKIKITKAAPKVVSLSHVHLFPPDTLKIGASNLSPKEYKYALILEKDNETISRSDVFVSDDSLKFVVPQNFTAGNYRVQISNLTDGKRSRENSFSLYVYSGYMPYAVLSGKRELNSGDNLEFQVYNFEKESYRFYQVSLTGSGKTFVQNGVYSKEDHKLTLSLPETIPKGSYTFQFSLSDPIKQLRYDFKTDDVVIIR